MARMRMGEAAALLGVSADTMRRWADSGRVASEREPSGHRLIEGVELARLAGTLTAEPPHEVIVSESARNRFRGLVTRVVRDTVMAQVELQAGPHRVVSLMSREAADQLGLEPGVVAVASVKATHVVVELPRQPGARA